MKRRIYRRHREASPLLPPAAMSRQPSIPEPPTPTPQDPMANNIQREARARQARTGERYTTALRHVKAKREAERAKAATEATHQPETPPEREDV